MIEAIGTLFIVATGIISGLFYNHRNRHYAEGKKTEIEYGKNFKYFYPLIRLTLGVAGIGSFYSDSPYLLKVAGIEPFLFSVGISIATIGLMLFVLSKVNLGANKKHKANCSY